MTRPTYPRAVISAANVKVLGHGNSLMAGVGASSPSTYWLARMAGLAPFAGKGITVENHGVGGMSIATDVGAGTMMATAAAAIDANLAAGKINILVIHEGINEPKGNGYNGTSTHNSWKAYCLARKAAAAAAGKILRIVTMTTTPAGADPTGGGQTAINTRMASIVVFNNLMRQQYRDYADVLCDVAAHPPFAAMYAANDWTQAAFVASGAYARSDGTADDYTHLGDAGYLKMAYPAARAMCRVRK